MIIIPEINTVVILVPRTGTSTLRRAIAEIYPMSMMIYRHMEADGIPIGYDRWHRVGVVRNPVDRLWSLYKFLRKFGGDYDSAYIETMRSSVAMPFDEWLIHNRIPFTSPYDSSGRNRFWPGYTVRHPLPENRKSQEIYLRPDLGTEVFRFPDRAGLFDALKLPLRHDMRYNSTEESPPPELSDDVWQHLKQWFEWDFKASF